MTDYIDRNHAIAALSILEVKNPGADLRDARRAIADVPEPGKVDKLRYALEVIRDECRSHNGRCRYCPLSSVKGIGIYCAVSDTIDYPADWKPEEMIQEVKNDG